MFFGATLYMWENTVFNSTWFLSAFPQGFGLIPETLRTSNHAKNMCHNVAGICCRFRFDLNVSESISSQNGCFCCKSGHGHVQSSQPQASGRTLTLRESNIAMDNPLFKSRWFSLVSSLETQFVRGVSS